MRLLRGSYTVAVPMRDDEEYESEEAPLTLTHVPLPPTPNHAPLELRVPMRARPRLRVLLVGEFGEDGALGLDLSNARLSDVTITLTTTSHDGAIRLLGNTCDLTSEIPEPGQADGCSDATAGAGTETLKTRSHHCAASRLAGRHEELGWPGVACGYRTHCGWAPLLNATTGQLDNLRARGLNEHQLWAALGGLSEAITDTFFTSVLGCIACARRVFARSCAPLSETSLRRKS